ncbi:MAG: hypothetical protein C4526_10325 [Nitrospiraceae bacterium]|nr:MAG: hypothetical protein C4526_10325 [Nitrospiraceae bacterium]
MKKVIILCFFFTLVASCMPAMRHYSGIKPIAPKNSLLLPQMTPVNVDSLQPDFKWEAAVEDSTTFDFSIWKPNIEEVKAASAYPESSISWGNEVYYVENLKDNFHKLERPLEYDTLYYWSVRKRRGSSVSDWSTFDETVIYTIGIATGRTSVSNTPFRFRTPAK